MKTYDIFLEYYDKIVRSINNPIEDEVEFLIEDCIKEYKPETKTILETACGTGIVAKELVNAGYKVSGLDINKKMLEKAELNLNPPLTPPSKGGEQKVELILADMTDFNLNKTFDTILCNYNSICHLLEWKQWQDFFEMSNKHLKKDGLFIFDINTVYEFDNITKDFAQFYNFGEDTVCLEMFKKDGIYEWLVKIFKKNPHPNPLPEVEGKASYNLIEEVVRENSFPVNKIKKELAEKGFKILEIIDYHYGEVTAQSERVYFICKKV